MGLWLLLRKLVFPWDVELSREMLAIQSQQHLGAKGDVEQLKQTVLAFWDSENPHFKDKLWGSGHKTIGSNPSSCVTDL